MTLIDPGDRRRQQLVALAAHQLEARGGVHLSEPGNGGQGENEIADGVITDHQHPLHLRPGRGWGGVRRSADQPSGNGMGKQLLEIHGLSSMYGPQRRQG
ncbi:hypothetical protein GOY18_15750 [Aeromonas hydrophila]|uniref:hypothetical protein n=1 Tax=Aeromonas hydrophila TaxID=644 RepID=UPI00214ACAFA